MSLPPDFHGVGDAAQVQPWQASCIGGDPGAVGVVTRRGNKPDHRPEVTAESDLEALLARHLARLVGNVQFVGEQDARVGRPPEDRLAILVPGKCSRGDGLRPGVAGLRSAAGREQPVGPLQGLSRGGKSKSVRVPGQHGGRGGRASPGPIMVVEVFSASSALAQPAPAE